MRTYIYIDGFNFYYGVVKNTPYKWVDFMSLFNKVLNPKHDILAIHALNDAWLDHYDCAVIVSNDRDLTESLRLIKEQNKKMVGLIFPSMDKNRHPSKALAQHADFTKIILKSTLIDCQLPNPIPGTNISKPIDW